MPTHLPFLWCAERVCVYVCVFIIYATATDDLCSVIFVDRRHIERGRETTPLYMCLVKSVCRV